MRGYACIECSKYLVTNALFGAILSPPESIAPFIKMAVWDKHAVRGGMDTQEKFSDETLNQENRSMIAIGG